MNELRSRPESAPRHGRIRSSAMVLFFIGIVSLPILFRGCPSERDRWTAAHAMVLFDRGERDVAIDRYRPVVEKHPDDVPLLLPYIQMLLKADREEEALEIARRIATETNYRQLGYQLMDQCLIRLGRFDEALEAFRQYEPVLKERESQVPDALSRFLGAPDLRLEIRATRLNDLAYHRALAGRELEEARANIESVISELSAQPWYPLEYDVTFVDRVVISIGLIGRQVGRTEEALEQLDGHVRAVERAIERLRQNITTQITDRVRSEFPFSADTEKRYKQLVFDFALGQRQLAVLLAVRALLYDDLDRDRERDRDRIRARKLGVDPEEVLRQIPIDLDCLRALQQGAAYLDTRAVVLMELGEFHTAWLDSNIAVLAIQILNATYAGGLQNSVSSGAGDFFDQDNTRRSEAALLYHRMLLAQKMQRSDLAELDRRRIKELGFEPGPHLN